MVESVWFPTRCLLAYGQTGSGKTHAMFGPPGALDAAAAAPSASPAADAGCVPRALADALVAVAARTDAVDATLTLSYLELYRERITDLLTGGAVRVIRVGEGAAADAHRAARNPTAGFGVP
jgi:hypothetical protein